MKKICFTLLCLVPFLYAGAQSADTTNKLPTPVISGYVDVYYKYNFNQNLTDNKTSFTNSQNSFELGMASVRLDEAYKKAGFTADLGYGKRAEEFSYNDHNTLLAIKQLFVYYSFTDHFKLSMGSFATHMGYELVDPYGNRNYSMSYAFSYGPFFNTGVKADFTFNPQWTAMVGLFDPNDFKSASFTNHKYIGAQIGYSSKSSVLKGYLNFIEGKDTFEVQNNQYNLILQYQPTSKFGVVLSEYLSSYQAPGSNVKNWTSSTLYLNYDFTSLFGLTLRTEYFTDKDGRAVFTDPIKFPNGGNILSFTLSGNFHLGSLTVIPELRLDNASENLFNTANGHGTQSTGNVLLAAYYKF